MSIRVLHVTGAYVPATAYGGPLVSTHAFVKALASAGAEVEVVTTDADGSARVPSGVHYVDGVRVSYHRAVPLNRHGISAALWLDVFRGLAKFDLVHCHGTALASTTVALWAGLARRKPVVVTPHGSLMAWAQRKKAWRKRAYGLLDRWPARRALFHATSEQEAADIVSLGFRHVCVVPNAVDLEAMRVPSRRDLRGELGIPQGRRIVAWLGRFDPVKNVEVLIEATEGLDVDVVMAGNASNDYGSRLRGLASRPRSGKVHFLGMVDDEARRMLLQQADVYAHPSHMESYGMSIVEALACGCPVVASSGTPWRTLQDDGAGFCVSATREAFGAAIERVLGGHLPELRARARAVASRHGWNARANAMLAEYEKHASRARRRGSS